MKVILSINPDALAKVAPQITIEAEYGERVVSGSIYTAAHHQNEPPFQSGVAPAPCNDKGIPYQPHALIGVSHIDLDTLGGIARVKGHHTIAHNATFWDAAEVIDLNGPHRMEDLVNPGLWPLFRAWWAWSSTHRSPRVPRGEQTLDVTSYVREALDTLGHILGPALLNDPKLIEAGQVWASENDTKEKASFVDIVDGVLVRCGTSFNNAFYRHDGKAYEAIVNFTPTTGAVTVSFALPKDGQSARAIVQSVWATKDKDGNHLAGGHDGIAGNPRGVRATFDEWYWAAKITSKTL